MSKNKVKITLKRSVHGQLHNIRASVYGLGLRRIRDTRVVEDTRSQSTRPISRPVASAACRTRRTLWAPSDASAGLPRASRSNWAPHSMSSRV